MEKCKECGTEQTPSDDVTTLNYYKLCRKCQRAKDVPKPWKLKTVSGYMYGCYFPTTDLNISEMARPGTGMPTNVEWL